MTPTILVTGFEPFGGETLNASWEAARRLDGERVGEQGIAARRLPCAYDESVAAFIAAFDELRPLAVLLSGQAARRALVAVEHFARNRDDAAAPDNRRNVRRGAAIDPAGPERVETLAPVGAIARAIRAAGIAARLSNDAGGYVCNHLYFGALSFLRARAPATRAVFLHLPAAPGQSALGVGAPGLPTEAAVAAMRAAAGALVA